MHTTKSNNSLIFKDFGGDWNSFVTNLTNEFEVFKNENIIIDLKSFSGLKTKDLNVFHAVSKMQKLNKKSFVLVIADFDFNKVSHKINIVPSVQEAHDIIEMEIIERDLGF
jgi:hypothetical protein